MKIRNNYRFSLPACIAVILFYLAGSGLLFAKEADIYKNLDVLCDVISIIQRDYIEKVDSENLTQGALRGMLRSLDGYSYFVPAPGADDAREPEVEKLGTYGLDVAYKNRVLTVISPVEGGPAWRAGLKPDDKIIKINDESVGESPLHELYNLFRGRVGEEVKLKVVRRGARDFLDFTLQPGKIEEPQARGELQEENIGLLRISRFDDGTEELVSRSLEGLKKEKADSLVIDIRNCPGGDIDAAVAVAGRFVPRGKLITSVKGRIEGLNREFRSTGDLLLPSDAPIVVLVNGGTSGAAEVLAVALHGSRKAVLMGQKTFGSAYTEGSFSLSDGSLIKLISGIYLSPGGEKIQGKGIEVDIPVELPEAVGEDEKAGEMGEPRQDENAGKEKEEKEEKERDPMLQGAIDLIKGIRIISTSGKEGL